MTVETQNGFPNMPQPLVDESRQITLPWRQFLVSLWVRTGGGGGSASTLLDTIGDVQGDTLYRGSAVWLAANIGTAGKLWRAGATIPAWSFIAGDSFAPQASNSVLAGPVSGPDATPSFRALVDGDAPPATVATGVTAAGTTQGTATALTARWTQVTSTPASSGVRMAEMDPGFVQVVWNKGGASLNVYPFVGVQIDALGVNAPYGLANGKMQVFSQITPTLVYSMQLG